MDTKERVRIAVAGHTNTGKTTLIRTLMRTVVGEVGDSPNVTQQALPPITAGGACEKALLGST